VRVAVIGASKDRSKFGNKAVRAYLGQGHDVYPVNPGEDRIEGLQAYRSILDIPVEDEGLDAVLVYLPPASTLRVLEDIARKGTRELYLNPGSEDAAVVERARELGLDPILACSIIAIGESPSSYGP
jgi:predicted CoA-binding protein